MGIRALVLRWPNSVRSRLRGIAASGIEGEEFTHSLSHVGVRDTAYSSQRPSPTPTRIISVLPVAYGDRNI